jgi:hypothetical protein
MPKSHRYNPAGYTVVMRQAGPGKTQVAVDHPERKPGDMYPWAVLVDYPADGPPDEAGIAAAHEAAKKWVRVTRRCHVPNWKVVKISSLKGTLVAIDFDGREPDEGFIWHRRITSGVGHEQEYQAAVDTAIAYIWHRRITSGVGHESSGNR